MKDLLLYDIAMAVRMPSTTLEEAASLIESYAKAYALGEISKALEQQHARNMAILEAPLMRAVP